MHDQKDQKECFFLSSEDKGHKITDQLTCPRTLKMRGSAVAATETWHIRGYITPTFSQLNVSQCRWHKVDYAPRWMGKLACESLGWFRVSFATSAKRTGPSRCCSWSEKSLNTSSKSSRAPPTHLPSRHQQDVKRQCSTDRQ